MKHSIEPLTISVTEAARVLGISKPKVYELVYRSDFPSFKVDSRILIPVASLRKWVEDQTGGSTL